MHYAIICVNCDLCTPLCMRYHTDINNIIRYIYKVTDAQVMHNGSYYIVHYIIYNNYMDMYGIISNCKKNHNIATIKIIQDDVQDRPNEYEIFCALEKCSQFN